MSSPLLCMSIFKLGVLGDFLYVCVYTTHLCLLNLGVSEISGVCGKVLGCK